MAFLSRFVDDPGRRTDELSGVIRDLQFLLNSRDGYGSMVSSYGLGAFEERQGSQDRATLLAEEVRAEVATHDPRLTDVEVKLLGKDPQLWVRMELHVTLRGRRVPLLVRFDTVHGQVVIEELPCP